MDKVKTAEVNEDDDTTTLSTNTLKALQEFYQEQDEKEKIIQNLHSESNIVSFDENWVD